MLFIAVLLLFGANAAQAQPADTLCVPVDQLQQLQQDVERLERRDSLNVDIKRNLRAQVAELETIARQDSIVITTLENELAYRKEQIELRNRRIDNLQTRLEKQEVRKWVWFAGGAASILLGAFVSGQAAN